MSNPDPIDGEIIYVGRKIQFEDTDEVGEIVADYGKWIGIAIPGHYELVFVERSKLEESNRS